MTGALLGRGLVPAVVHTERREDIVFEVHVERLPAGSFDETTYPAAPAGEETMTIARAGLMSHHIPLNVIFFSCKLS